MALNNSQYDTILRAYEQKQLHNRKIQEKRMDDVCRDLPEFQEIHQSISALSVGQARKLLEGDDRALEELKEQIQTLSNRAKELLLENGYPEDYLDPIYDCPDCKDTGYVGNEKCQCFRKATIDLLYTQSNRKHILEKENFDTFTFLYYSRNHVDPSTGANSLANIEKAYTSARQFVDTFGKEFHNLFLYGDTGVGKTFLTNCIAKELMDQSYSVIYFSAFELFDALAKSQFGKDEGVGHVQENILDCDLLIIDDLGTELTNSFTVSQLFLCLNERILRKKATIISTNLSLESLVNIYSERTFSRITSNFTMLKLTGDDIRIKKKLMNREDNSCYTAQNEH